MCSPAPPHKDLYAQYLYVYLHFIELEAFLDEMHTCTYICIILGCDVRLHNRIMHGVQQLTKLVMSQYTQMQAYTRKAIKFNSNHVDDCVYN